MQGFRITRRDVLAYVLKSYLRSNAAYVASFLNLRAAALVEGERARTATALHGAAQVCRAVGLESLAAGFERLHIDASKLGKPTPAGPVRLKSVRPMRCLTCRHCWLPGPRLLLQGSVERAVAEGHVKELAEPELVEPLATLEAMAGADRRGGTARLPASHRTLPQLLPPPRPLLPPSSPPVSPRKSADEAYAGGLVDYDSEDSPQAKVGRAASKPAHSRWSDERDEARKKEGEEEKAKAVMG
jgi:hypothetical protein